MDIYIYIIYSIYIDLFRCFACLWKITTTSLLVLRFTVAPKFFVILKDVALDSDDRQRIAV